MAKPGPKCGSKYDGFFLEDEAIALEKWVKLKGTTAFWLKEFALERGYHSSYFAGFAEKSEHFAKALKRAKDQQEINLCRYAMIKGANQSFAIFALKNIAGWRDSIEHLGNKDNPLELTINYG